MQLQISLSASSTKSLKGATKLIAKKGFKISDDDHDASVKAGEPFHLKVLGDRYYFIDGDGKDMFQFKIDEKKYRKLLKDHSGSARKQDLHSIPKLSDLWKYSDEFSEETNEKAKQRALKEIQRLKNINSDKKEENKATRGARKAMKQLKEDDASKTLSGINVKRVIANLVGDPAIKKEVHDSVAERKNKTVEDVREAIKKSDHWRKSKLFTLGLRLQKSNLKGEARKEAKAYLKTLMSASKADQDKLFDAIFV